MILIISMEYYFAGLNYNFYTGYVAFLRNLRENKTTFN